MQSILSRYVILDHQARAVCLFDLVAAVESQLVDLRIIVIIDLESQAELGKAFQVYIPEGGAIDPGPMPAIERVVLDQTDRFHAGRALEVGDLQASVWERTKITKRTRVDIHQDVLVGGKWIYTGHALLFDHQEHSGDDSIIGQDRPFPGEHSLYHDKPL